MKKVLITGTTGMLGTDLVRLFGSLEKYKVFGLGRSTSSLLPKENQFKIDLTNKPEIESLNFIPDIVIHTAALTDLSLCEREPELANRVHVEASKTLARIGGKRTKFFYLSTDSVFDGKKGNYTEKDIPNPLNVYASSKLKGEIEVQNVLGDSAIILRTNIYGFHQPMQNSMVEWAYREWMLGKTISGFTDTIFNAVFTYQLAEIIEFMIDEEIVFPIINIGSDEAISKFDFLEKLRKELKIERALLTPALSATFTSPIKRPKDTSLNTTLLSTFYSVPDFESGIKDWMTNFSVRN